MPSKTIFRILYEYTINYKFFNYSKKTISLMATFPSTNPFFWPKAPPTTALVTSSTQAGFTPGPGGRSSPGGPPAIYIYI